MQRILVHLLLNEKLNLMQRISEMFICTVFFLYCNNVFLGNLLEGVYHIFPHFPKVGLDHEGWSPIPFKIFIDHFTIFNSSPMKHLKWRPFVTKKR